MVQKAHFEETAVVTRYNFCTFIFLRVLNECMMIWTALSSGLSQ